VDDLLNALPPALMDMGSGIAFRGQGEVTIGDDFRDLLRSVENRPCHPATTG
jgi:hypothetical protein